MKANELMIGDWVKIKTYGVSDKFERTEAHIYVKVAEIGSGLITVDYNNNIKESYRICENTEIEPIPLTAEILEKNGFEKAPQISDVEPFDADEDGNNYYSYNKIFWGWFQPGSIFCIPANGMGWLHIKYVHQLQHALRLCGIEKTIEL